jgi:hypothetical protein
MLRIVTRIASRFAATAGVLLAANGCAGDETATGPQRSAEQPAKPLFDEQPSGLTLFNGYSFLPFTPDVGGANDYSGQNDVNQMSRADNVAGFIGVAWTWDEVDAWTGAGQTGDACSLFDTDVSGNGVGNVDYALCVRITNLNGNPANPVQAQGSPILYECSDKKPDRCTTTFTIKPKADWPDTFCEVVKTTTDAFPNVGDDGADVMAACGIKLSEINTATSPKFLNVCSYPSGSPNSNPFDCILVDGSGYLKIVKKTTPDNQQPTNTFSFLLKSGTQDAGVTHQVADDEPGDDVSALIPLDPTKTYSLEETNLPAGWALGTANCTGSTLSVTKDGNKLSGIKTTVGATVICTFENAQNGSITITKDAKPNADQNFAYTVTGAGLEAFNLDDDSDNTLSNSKPFTGLAAGVRTISETAATGWKITSISCSGNVTSTVKYGVKNGSYDATYSDGDNSVEIDLKSGENVSCTFENTKLGLIAIVKNADPNDEQDFGYTSVILGSFSLDDDSDETLPNVQQFGALLPNIYKITETGQSGWTITGIACSGFSASTVKIGTDSDFDPGDDYVEIDLKNGEGVGCTFTNTKHGSITVVKNAVPDHSQVFSYTTTNLTPATFSLVDDGSDSPPVKSQVFPGLLPGTYGVAEDGETGWALTNISCPGASAATIGASSVSIELAAGENVTCTFENTQGGSITIVKDAQPDHAQDFAFTATGTGVSDVDLDDDGDNANTLKNSKTFSGLQPGLRTITESAVTDWKITNITCSGKTNSTVLIGADDDFDATDNSVSITLAAGENITCTFENTKKPSVTVEKSVNPTSIPETGGAVTYTVTVTNTSGIPVTLTGLSDNKFDILTIQGTTCSVPQPLAASGAGAVYQCSFSATLPAAEAGDTYINEVTATVSNAGGTGTDTDDATVTYTNVNPNISVTKTANPTSLSTAAAGTLNFTADQTWSSNPTPPSPGDPNFATQVCDDAGANDINSAQVDINCFDRADNISGKLYVKWTWDDINAWSGGGSTGDGCALIDTDNDGNVNLAFCARITNPGGGPITQVPQAGAVDVYVCNDSKTDRCAKPVTQLLGIANIGTTTCTIANAPEGFPNEGDDGSDTEATCIIDKAMPSLTNVSIDLVNVCTFPSGEPNSNPFDCVVEVGSGFIQIVKVATPASSQLFGFTLNGAANNGDTKFAVAGGVTSGLIAVKPSGGQVPTYSLTETLPSNWNFTNVSCAIDNVPTGSKHATLPQISGIAVNSGQTTVCTFTNTGTISGPVEYTIRVTNLGKENVTLTSLTDDKFGNLNGVGTCATGGTIAGSAAGNLYYECKFTQTISGAPGTSHINEVTAVAKDNETPQNSDTKKATATVSFVSPP